MTGKDLTHSADDTAKALEKVLSGLKEMTGHFAEDAGDALSKSAHSLAEAATDLAEQAKVKSKAAIKKVGEEVHDHPVATAAVVAAAVAVLGLALAQRKGKKG